MMKKWMSLLLVALLTYSITAVPVQAGKPTNPNTGGVPGSWTEGTAPDRIDPSKPAILFVHGLNSSASVWYENNDMYEKFHSNGFQTAFINLYDITGTSQSMWDNGRLLSDKIKEISKHFGKKLIIVAHSKGGVDTQTAIVHYDAAPYVQRVITLGSPHHGSQLADLAYSSWAGWLAELIGSQSPGTASVQTSYMKSFRSQTDGLSASKAVPFYTLAGNNWSSGSTSHFFGGLYLSTFGDNDGVVTVQNSYLPHARMISVGSWNHSTVRTGSHVYSLLSPYLQQKEPAQLSSASFSYDQNAVHSSASPSSSSFFIRGGQHDGQASQALMIEDGVDTVKLDWINDQPLKNLELMQPDGSVKSVQLDVYQDSEVFQGAWHHTAVLQQPEPGTYHLTASASDAGAYLMVAQFNRAEDFKISLKSSGSEIKLQQQGQASVTDVTYSVYYYGNPGDSSAAQLVAPSLSGKVHTASSGLQLSAINKPGIYSITVETEGITEKGFPYRRTIVQSLYIDEDGRKYGL